jgi:hypothetical protein
MSVSFVTRLQQVPGAFSHGTQGMACIETHISWVVLAGEHAYKFKKPLRFHFLDYSTPALRRAACEEEVRINRRTAPAIYLEVVAVVGTPQSPRIVPLAQLRDGDAAFDWGVHMRRFGQDQLLSRLLEEGALQPGHVDCLAQHLADFHAAAAVAGEDSPWGQPQAIRRAVSDNFASVQAVVQGTPLADTVNAVHRWSEVQGEQLAPLMAQRRAQGRVREGHGDLHLGNLVMLDGQPQLFDAIEFQAGLRWIDVLADLAFVLMDLQARGRADLAWRLLNGYLEHTGDYGALQLLTYYQCDRAMVRAKVAALRLAQQGGRDDALRQEVARYLRLAGGLTRPREPVLWLVTGVSGSGKSSQTQGLIERLGLVRIRSDVERRRLHGVPRLGRSAEHVPQGIYTAEAGERTYAQLAALAHDVLAAGWPVLVDATFLKRAQRRTVLAVGQRLGVPCRMLVLDAPPAVLRERVAQRMAEGRDPSEADGAVLERQLQQREPLDADEQACAVQVDTRAPVDWAAVLPPAWIDAPAQGVAPP